MPTTQVSARISEETKVIVPARTVLSAESAARVRQMIAQPPEPSEDLKRLFDDR